MLVQDRPVLGGNSSSEEQGKCIEHDTEGYICECAQGWAGPHCEEAKSQTKVTIIIVVTVVGAIVVVDIIALVIWKSSHLCSAKPATDVGHELT